MTYLEASLSRKVTAPIRSSGVPILPAGMREIHWSRSLGFSSRILRVLNDEERHQQQFLPEVCSNVSRRPCKSYSQSSEHIARANAVNTDIMTGPLHSERSSKVAYSSLRGVVRSLGLGNINDSAGHGADHDDAPGRLPLHQVLSNINGEKVCAVDIDTPQLLHTVEGVVDGLEVLGEAGRRDQVIDLAVLGQDFGHRIAHRVGVSDVGIMGGDLGHTVWN